MKLHYERFPLPAFPRNIIAIAVFALCSGHASAINPFTVKDIRVEGIQRTEAGTVFSYLPVRVGETYTDEKGITAIKALFATGFFKDVRLEVEGDVLVVLLDERPAIASIDFTGAKEFEKDVLTKALKEIGLGVARIFDKALADRAEQELKRQYLSRGMYGVQIKTTVKPIERNRVNVTFVVDEGEASHIKQINIVGNKAFSDSELLKYLSLSTSGWFTWFSKVDQYSKQKLTGDIETLKSFYLNRGYLEFQIESTQVSITPDKKDIYITINITEGEKYTVSDIKLEGELLGQDADLKSLLSLKSGDVYSGEKLQDSVKKIQDRLGNFGYAFANVNANPDINREKKTVAFTVLIDPAKRVYVHRINISGNTKTRDEVIRREFREFEGSWYDNQKIKMSRDRVERLGYFKEKEVNIETPEVPGTTDQVDINLSVVENPTSGSISAGGGYSSSEKVSFFGSIQEVNAFGSGDTIGLNFNTSALNRTIAVSEYDPYFTDDGISRGYQVFYRTSRPPLINSGDYNIITKGGNVTFGVPFSEYDTVFFGIGAEQTKVQTYSNIPGYNNSPQVYLNYVATYGDGINATTTSFPLTAAWQRDNRDNVVTPTVGRLQSAHFELSAIGDQKYYRGTYKQEDYLPLTRIMTLAMNGEFDYGKGFGGKAYPTFKNFYAGGIGSVRGYETSSLGPYDPLTRDPLGGTTRLVGNVELQFPFPGSANDHSLRWFFFADGGTVFAAGEKVRMQELRYAAGVGISWVSPVGPLKISYGTPIHAQSTDRIQRFQFQMGTGF